MESRSEEPSLILEFPQELSEADVRRLEQVWLHLEPGFHRRRAHVLPRFRPEVGPLLASEGEHTLDSTCGNTSVRAHVCGDPFCALCLRPNRERSGPRRPNGHTN